MRARSNRRPEAGLNIVNKLGRSGILAGVALIGATVVRAEPPADATDYTGDARAVDRIIVENYAYQDHWPGGVLPDSPELAHERAGVHDRDSLLHYAEDRISSLADHHAITGSSFPDSWAIVPTYADLWIERRGSSYVIDSVKPGSPAALAGVKAGDRLVGVAGVPTGHAVAGFWQRLGLDLTQEGPITLRGCSLPGGATVRAT